MTQNPSALWAGRFNKDTDARMKAFNDSFAFDCRLYAEDIRGSIAHARMLGECGIIEKAESARLTEGLQNILHEIETGALTLPADAEDIHMCIETLLTERLGETGKRLHTARSRNDQVALDFKLYVRTQTQTLVHAIFHLQNTLTALARKHLHTVMPGYTHMQRAQPVTLAHHFMAWCEMLKRDAGRLSDALKRMDEMPLGAGALAGTTYPINREAVAQELGFTHITANAMDTVADRDFALETLSALSILMVHLSRMSEEIILWCGAEFGFATVDDAYGTGSSIMPQKKNPDAAELTRGKTGRVIGSLVTLLTVMKGLPLAYNKDMQEDKEAVFDALDTVSLCLEVFAPMLSTMVFHPKTMERAASRGFLNATDAADYLVRKGMAFRDAYTLVGKLVSHCLQHSVGLEELELSFLQGLNPLFEQDFYEAVGLAHCVASRSVPGGPAPEAVLKHIEATEIYLKNEMGRYST